MFRHDVFRYVVVIMLISGAPPFAHAEDIRWIPLSSTAEQFTGNLEIGNNFIKIDGKNEIKIDNYIKYPRPENELFYKVISGGEQTFRFNQPLCGSSVKIISLSYTDRLGKSILTMRAYDDSDGNSMCAEFSYVKGG